MYSVKMKLWSFESKFIQSLYPFNSPVYVYLIVISRVLFIMLFFSDFDTYTHAILALIAIVQTTLLFNQMDNPEGLKLAKQFERQLYAIWNYIIDATILIISLDKVRLYFLFYNFYK